MFPFRKLIFLITLKVYNLLNDLKENRCTDLLLYNYILYHKK